MGAPLIQLTRVRSVVTERSGFGVPAEITLNPYRGCAFGCSYCYARKFVHDDLRRRVDWGNWVEVKENAVDALLRDCHKCFDKSVFVGSATDPYQPSERSHRITRSMLEVLLRSFPRRVHIQTRSPFVVDDIPLLREFGDRLTVGVSIPTDSDIVRKAFEPRAPSIARRITTAGALLDAGIHVEASIAPLLPCTPRRLAKMLSGKVNGAWIGSINFHGDEGNARGIYRARGWESYLDPAHKVAVTEAMADAGLIEKRDKRPVDDLESQHAR